jgi:hypothetical protein
VVTPSGSTIAHDPSSTDGCDPTAAKADTSTSPKLTHFSARQRKGWRGRSITSCINAGGAHHVPYECEMRCHNSSRSIRKRPGGNKTGSRAGTSTDSYGNEHHGTQRRAAARHAPCASIKRSRRCWVCDAGASDANALTTDCSSGAEISTNNAPETALEATRGGALASSTVHETDATTRTDSEPPSGNASPTQARHRQLATPGTRPAIAPALAS